MGQAQRIPELGMRFLIGRKLPDSLHLDYKQDIGLIPCLYRFCQFQNVLDAPLGRRVGEHGDAVLLQSYTFDFHKGRFRTALKRRGGRWIVCRSRGRAEGRIGKLSTGRIKNHIKSHIKDHIKSQIEPGLSIGDFPANIGQSECR